MVRVPAGLVDFWLQMMLLSSLIASSVSPVSSQGSQSGFLSIDCGSEEEYEDPITRVKWVPDAAYISTGTILQNLSLPDDFSNSFNTNMEQLRTLRYFHTQRNKYCFVLPVKPQTKYLLRPTFFPGVLKNTTFAFEMYLNNTYWSSYDSLAGQVKNLVQSQEVIFYSTGNELNFCLVPTSYDDAFISALELRELAAGMYSTVGPSNDFLLSNVLRAGFNPSSDITFRYPYDDYDRLWVTYSSAFVRGSGSTAVVISKEGISSSPALTPDLPAPRVMENALVYYGEGDNTITLTLTVDALFSGYLYASIYVQELDGNASASNVRGMDFYFNDVLISSFNSSDEPLEVTSPIQILNTRSQYKVSIFRTSWSKLPPILNAIEIYSIANVSLSRTATEDVATLAALQQRFNLVDWTGDPCFPLPYNWLGCSNDSEARVTHLFLGSMGIMGTIPAEFINLTALSAIELQNNKLTGEIPNFLADLPSLTLLNLDNNTLSGKVPQKLDSKLGLNFTVKGNPGLSCDVAACGFTPSHKSYTGAAVGGAVGGLVAVSTFIWIGWCVCTRKKRARSSIIRSIIAQSEKSSPRETPISKGALAGSIKALSLQEVSDATKKFSRKLGQGSFGPVYYGKLPDGQEVAVKVKARESSQGSTQFLNEVSLLSRIHHRNLVSLVGYCEEGNQQMLIYAFAPNLTLRDHLYRTGDNSRSPLDWRTRLDIALNSARGLEYLHTDCKPRIIHRDVKSSNILLDENLVAKVADFGISKQAPEGVFSGVDTLLRGTPGYFDPEYFILQRLTQKSDVYSFGVVLLEIVTGRHPHLRELPDGTMGTLIQWVKMSWREGKILDVIDPTLEGKFNYESMMKVILLALGSVDMAASKRPTMMQVVRTLTDAVNLEMSSNMEIIDDKLDLDATAPVDEDIETTMLYLCGTLGRDEHFAEHQKERTFHETLDMTNEPVEGR